MLVCIYILIVLLSNSVESLQVNECHFSNNSMNPCVHGICLAQNKSESVDYQCYCLNGYTGTNCNKRVDLCLHHNPCQNSESYLIVLSIVYRINSLLIRSNYLFIDAICVNSDGIPDVQCICSPGFCGLALAIVIIEYRLFLNLHWLPAQVNIANMKSTNACHIHARMG